jgi:hypothetical protein
MPIWVIEAVVTGGLATQALRRLNLRPSLALSFA